MNRGRQLEQTLEINLATIAKLGGEAELCLVNFIKDEEGEAIDEWVRSIGPKPNFTYAISRELAHWHAPTAKNTAHLLGKSDFLINLDCDNFISGSIARKLLATPEEQLCSSLFSGFTGGFREKRVKTIEINPVKKVREFVYIRDSYGSIKPKKLCYSLKSKRINSDRDRNGTYGHIGLPKAIFKLIGGYDETFPPMGGQDKDIMWRTYNVDGIRLLHIPQPANELPILNKKNESLKHTREPDADWDKMQGDATQKTRERIKAKRLIANQGHSIGVFVEIIFNGS